MVASIEESLKRFEDALDKLQAAIERHGEAPDAGSAARCGGQAAALAEAEARVDRLKEVNAQLSDRITGLIAEVRSLIETTDAGNGE